MLAKSMETQIRGDLVSIQGAHLLRQVQGLCYGVTKSTKSMSTGLTALLIQKKAIKSFIVNGA
jgi:hypothetical protein